MLTVVHASDLHFGSAFNQVAGDAFITASRALDPDFLVLSGDFTQRAKVREFEEVVEYMELLPEVPKVVTPGNHDVPLYRVFERLFTPFRNYREYISEDLDRVYHLPGTTVVSLATAAPRRAIVNGRIRGSQLEFAARAFQSAPPGDLRVVVAHHHFAPAPDYQGDRALPGARDALDVFYDLEVELILGGHLHRAYIGNSLDVYPGDDEERGIIIVQSGTTTSSRGRAREEAKNSFNVLRISEEFVEITHYMYFDEVGGFAPFSMHAFPRRAQGYFLEDPYQTGLHQVLRMEEEAPLPTFVRNPKGPKSSAAAQGRAAPEDPSGAGGETPGHGAEESRR